VIRDQWYEDRLAALVHTDGDWRRYELRRDERGDDTCTTDAGAHVRVSCTIGSSDGLGDARWRLDVEVAPDSHGGFAGVQIVVPIAPQFHCIWKPHLAPVEGMTIGDKAFRSPAIVLESESHQLALVPDLTMVRRHGQPPHVMDYVAQESHLVLGVCEYAEVGHVYYELRPRWSARSGSVRFGADLWLLPRSAGPPRGLQQIERLLWEGAGASLRSEPPPLKSLDGYVEHAYRWAFEEWDHVCWQEFEIEGGRKVGGVTAIVTAGQKAGLGEERNWREPKSLWNQAWFSSLHSAYGYAVWGDALDRADWRAKARLSLNFALSAPQVNGLFPAYYEADESGCWENGSWKMSAPRRPDGLEGYAHLLDCSWTCYWLLKWYRDVDPDDRILDYVRRYVDRLLTLQSDDGAIPAWVEPHTLSPAPWLQKSPETSLHATLLCLLNDIRGCPGSRGS